MTDRISGFQIKIKIIVILLIITLVLSVVYFLLMHYSVKTVIVEGNQHYSSKEIEDMVVKGYLGDNSLFLSLKYKNKAIEDVPFIESMDVKVVSNDTIKISVYEKALAGFVEYLGRYMYFDHDGVVVEISKTKTLGIPEVCGLNVDYAVLYETLPVSEPDIFKNILSITKLLNKYDVNCDKIVFDDSYNVKLYYDNVKVNIGQLTNLDEKIMQLPFILPKISGQKGTLDMSNYSSENTTISFEKE